jgi:Tfp pilus assembly protein PilV
MKARRGFTLIMTLIVMFFFAILCGAVFGMAQMNVTYNSFFERRGVLEQATLTFAESLAETVKDNAASWWSGADVSALGNGVYTVPPIAGARPMKFTYVISPDKGRIYRLFVKGEYTDSDAEDITWGVSVDISTVSSADAWSKIVRM